MKKPGQRDALLGKSLLSIKPQFPLTGPLWEVVEPSPTPQAGTLQTKLDRHWKCGAGNIGRAAWI